MTNNAIIITVAGKVFLAIVALTFFFMVDTWNANRKKKASEGLWADIDKVNAAVSALPKTPAIILYGLVCLFGLFVAHICFG